MNTNTASLLRRSFQDASLMALFIDLQEFYRYEPTYEAFHSSGLMASELRNHNVPITWAVTPEYRSADMPQIAPYAAFTFETDDCIRSVSPSPDDMVVIKYHPNLMTSKPAKEFIKNSEVSTLIVGGVFASRCVASSAIGIIRDNPDINVVIAGDCVDLREHSSKQYLEIVQGCLRYPQERERLHIMPHEQIADVLGELALAA